MRRILSVLIIVQMATLVWGVDEFSSILPSDVRAALNNNALVFSGARITGERSCQPIGSAATVLKTLQTLETEADFAKTLRFDMRFQGQLFRESIEHDAGDIHTYTRDAIYEVSFDGTKFFLGYKRLKDLASSNIEIYTPSIAIEYGRQRRNGADALARMNFWYLRQTGFVGPETMGDVGQSVESTIVKAANLGQIVSVAKGTDGNEKILEVNIEQSEPWQSTATFDIETHEPFKSLIGDGRFMQMRIERERRQLAGKHRILRFWLDSTLGYAVVQKWELRKETGETMFHTTNSDFVRVGTDGVWMPKRSVIKSHTYDTVPLLISPKPLYETVILIDQFEPAKFDNDQFRIWYDSPGVTVADYTSPNATLDSPDEYSVPAPIDDLVKGSPQSKLMLIALNILVAVGLIGWWYWRSHKKKAAG